MITARLKVCCITSVRDALLAVAEGATALGFVSESVGPPAVLPDDEIRAIIQAAPAGTVTVLLTAEVEARAVAEHLRRTGASAVQLVDRVANEERAALRQSCPDVTIIQVVHVVGEESVDEACTITNADVLLLDSGNPTLTKKQFGGTGRVHDWSLSRRIRDVVRTPVVLAGGLNPENVAEAIAVVRPYGVDVCSGVRTNGLLDRPRLARFAAAVRENSRLLS